MSAPTKGRHVSYYLSLPLVAAIVFLAVAQLAAWQRADMVAKLADRVAHEDANEATTALRQLAAMPRPPLDVLVTAAASSDQTIADEAQHLIDRLLRQWQRQLTRQRRVKSVARQLADLAGTLALQQPEFSRGDHRWLDRTARKVLRLANTMPADQSPLVAADCDAVLAAIHSSRPAPTASNEFAGQPVMAAVATPAGGNVTQSGRAELERDFAAFAARPFAAGVAGIQADPQTTGIETGAAPAEPSEPSDESKQQDTTSRVLEWTHPILHPAPAMPIHVQPAAQRQAASGRADERSSGLTSEITAAERPLADADSRELLRRWLEAEGREIFPLEQELTQRGFGRLSARLVEQLFSDAAEQRLRLVDDVLTEPGVDARPWLVLLADDANADVRLLAVTIMATSDDRALIDKAWEVAIRDRDPRIAGLAGRLRDRRDSLHR